MSKIRHELHKRHGTVAAVEHVRPRLRRVTIRFDESTPGVPWTRLAVGDHLKLVLPDPTTSRVGLDGPDPLVTRDYSIRAVPEPASVVVDIVVHGCGPGSNWAASAHVGSPVGVVGPRGSIVLPSDPPRYIALIDPSATPCAARLLEEAPSSATVVVGCAGDIDEIPPWPERDNSLVTSLPAGDAAAMVELLRSLRPRQHDLVWAAGETNMMLAVRAATHRLSLRSEQVMIRGYWKQGVAGRDHHAPLDA